MFFMQLPLEGLPLIALLLAFIIWVVGLVVTANSRFQDNTTKLCWFLIILFLNFIGVLLFVLWGRKEIAGSERK
jgi:hypothetical protein